MTDREWQSKFKSNLGVVVEMFRDDRKEGMDKMTIDYVVKLGGSAVTDKNVLEKAKLGEIARAVQIVKMCRQHGRSCIVVHGAGLVF